MHQKFTQKWSLISMLEPVEEGYEFFWKDYPLHVTLASVFRVDWQKDNLWEKLADLLKHQPPVEIRVIKEGYWGENGDYHMMELEKSPEITRLHNTIHDFLLEHGVVYNEPQHAGKGYIPHSTIQKHARLHEGEEASLTGITLLDMFPHADGYQRRIGPTIPFKTVDKLLT